MNGTLGNDGLNSKKKTRHGWLSSLCLSYSGSRAAGTRAMVSTARDYRAWMAEIMDYSIPSTCCLSGGADGCFVRSTVHEPAFMASFASLKEEEKSKTGQKAKGSYAHTWYPSHVFYPRWRLDRIGFREMILCNLYHHRSLLSLSFFIVFPNDQTRPCIMIGLLLPFARQSWEGREQR